MLVAAPEASSQTLSEGARVRVPTPEVKLKGTLASTDREAFTLALENGGLLTVRRDSVEYLEVFAGRKGNAGRGFLIGVFVGGVGGIAACDAVCESPIGWAALFGVFIGGIGAPIGHFIKSDRWERVDTGPQITLTLPKRGIGAEVQVGW